MACNISKHLSGCSNFSGSLANSVLFSGISTIEFSGSGFFVNMNSTANGNAADETSPITKSDISELF